MAKKKKEWAKTFLATSYYWQLPVGFFFFTVHTTQIIDICLPCLKCILKERNLTFSETLLVGFIYKKTTKKFSSTVLRCMKIDK